MSALASKPAAFLSAALGSGADRPSDETSERILDAALSLSAASGIRHLTIDDVAQRAGVGRMTVYRRFGDKARLLEALAVREGQRCLAELAAAADESAPLAEQVAAGFAAALRIAREHPLLNRLASHEPEAVLEALVADDSLIFRMGCAFAAERIRVAPDGAALGADTEQAAELLVRLALSFVLIQQSALPLDDEERAREVAGRLLAAISSRSGR